MLELDQKKVAGPVIRLHPGDNSVVARQVIDRGVEIPSEGVTTRDKIPAGSKLAARAIVKGEAIVKYNMTVGFAAEDIAPGTWLHNHNTAFREFDRDYAHASEYRPINVMPESEQATFQGI
ncbi:MAG: UxaA family hydrolase, partial [Hyphomicrobiaceae bacterium]